MKNDQSHHDADAAAHEVTMGRTADAGTAIYQTVFTARSDTSALRKASITEIERGLSNRNAKIALKH